MATSFQLPPFGKNPRRTSRTPGPLGHNDAGSPDAPEWVKGDTPGSLGSKDWDPWGVGLPPPHEYGYFRMVAAARAAREARLQELRDSVKDLGVPETDVTSHDATFSQKGADKFIEKVAEVAKRVDLNPGLLAISMLAELHGIKWHMGGTGNAFDLGVDDYSKRRRAIEKAVPAAKDVRFVGKATTDENEQGRTVETAHFNPQDAILAHAAYLKFGEIKVREHMAGKYGVQFDELPVELRFALTRYAMNAGIGAAKGQIDKLLEGKDIVQRSGPRSVQRPLRTAFIHTARAIHLSKKFFNVQP